MDPLRNLVAGLAPKMIFVTWMKEKGAKIFVNTSQVIREWQKRTIRRFETLVLSLSIRQEA